MQDTSLPQIRKILGFAVAIVVALIVINTTRQAILKGGSVVDLANAPQLSGVIAQSLNNSSKASLPVPSKDFIIKSVRFFSGNTWAVAYINPTEQNFDPSYVVLQKYQGLYRVVLGPSAEFDSSIEQSLPADLTAYLNQQGVIHDSTAL